MKPLRVGVLVLLVVLLVIGGVVASMAVRYYQVTSLPPPPALPYVQLEAASWNHGNISINLTLVRHADLLDPTTITYRVEGHGFSYFTGRSGEVDVVLNQSFSAWFVDSPGAGAHKLTLDDHFEVRVDPDTANPVRGGNFWVMSANGELFGGTLLPQ